MPLTTCYLLHKKRLIGHRSMESQSSWTFRTTVYSLGSSPQGSIFSC